MKFELRARLRATIDKTTDEQHAADTTDLLREISALSGVELAPADDCCTAITLNVTHAELEYPEVQTETGAVRINLPHAAFDIGVEVSVNPDRAFRNFWVFPQHREAALRANALHRFDEGLAALALATYLAQPDKCHFLAPQYHQHADSAFESKVAWGGLRRGVVISQEIGWPQLHHLPIRDVLDWLRHIPGWGDGIGRGPVGRAVAAFSQSISLDKHSTSGLSLLWAMIGLEALYCRGGEGLKSQLKEKSQLLLGAFQTHKRRFGQVYDFRSSFIHGVVDLPFAHRERSDDDDVWDHILKSDEEASLALVTLLASIQQLVIRRWYHLEFALSLSSPPHDA